MFDSIQRFLRINHRPVKIDRYNILVHKKISKDMQDEINEVITLLKLLDYDFGIMCEKRSRSIDIDLIYIKDKRTHHVCFVLNKRKMLKENWIIVSDNFDLVYGAVYYYDSTRCKNQLIPIRKLKDFIMND